MFLISWKNQFRLSIWLFRVSLATQYLCHGVYAEVIFIFIPGWGWIQASRHHSVHQLLFAVPFVARAGSIFISPPDTNHNEWGSPALSDQRSRHWNLISICWDCQLRPKQIWSMSLLNMSTSLELLLAQIPSNKRWIWQMSLSMIIFTRQSHDISKIYVTPSLNEMANCHLL